MYRVRSTDVWFNLPGVVAAYQPVAAPGPLLARYNQAHGGDNRYRAVDGTAPTWEAATGWRMSASARTHLVASGLKANTVQCVLVAYANVTSVGAVLSEDSYGVWDVWPYYSASALRFRRGGDIATGTSTPAGVIGFNGQDAIKDGATTGTIPTGTIPTGTVWLCGKPYAGDSPDNGLVRAILLVSRLFSPAEIWHASRQMAYCDVNPEWSAWGRRRRYYYAPEQAATGLAFSPVGSGVIGSSVVRSVQ